MEIKTFPRKKGSVRHDVVVKQIHEYLKVKPNSKDEGHKENI